MSGDFIRFFFASDIRMRLPGKRKQPVQWKTSKRWKHGCWIIKWISHYVRKTERAVLGKYSTTGCCAAEVYSKNPNVDHCPHYGEHFRNTLLYLLILYFPPMEGLCRICNVLLFVFLSLSRLLGAKYSQKSSEKKQKWRVFLI